MKIKMDAVVAEFVYIALRSVFSKPHANVEFGELPNDEAEPALMIVLGDMVACGFVRHTYVRVLRVDKFAFTDRMKRNWEWLCPGSTFPKCSSPCLVMKLSGNRSKYIGERWAKLDPEDPPAALPC